jgi:hypothetical protein
MEIAPEVPSLDVPVANVASPLMPAEPAFEVFTEMDPLEVSELAPLVR